MAQFNKFFKSPAALALFSSVGLYGGFRLFSDNGRELTMIRSSTSLNHAETTPTDGALVKMQGIVGKLNLADEVENSSQFTSGNRLRNDVQFHPVLASKSSFVYSKPRIDPGTGEYIHEYENDNGIMAYIFELEEKGAEKYESRSQWVVARPGFAAQSVDDFQSGVGFLDFVPTSHRVYDLDLSRNCYIEYPEDSDNSVHSVETSAPFTYVPPQSKYEVLEMMVKQGIISYPQEWTMDDLMDNVKAHVIHRTKPRPIPIGKRVRITEGFINSGDQLFLCGNLVTGSPSQQDEFDRTDSDTFRPIVPGVRCNLLVNGKNENDYTRELRAELFSDTAVATGTLATVLYGVKIFSRFM